MPVIVIVIVRMGMVMIMIMRVLMTRMGMRLAVGRFT